MGALQSERPAQCKTNVEPKYQPSCVVPSASLFCRTCSVPGNRAPTARGQLWGVDMVNVLEVNLELRKRYGEPGGGLPP
jgi:hypothetical protein